LREIKQLGTRGHHQKLRFGHGIDGKFKRVIKRDDLI
jgi:hypothetical protein